MSVSQAQQLADIRSRILTLLLDGPELVEALLEPPSDPATLSADTAAQISGLRDDLALLHAADIADILEALPEDERQALWRLVDNSRRGQVLVEASETVWESLTEVMSDKDILQAIAPLDIDDQAYLARYLPRDLTGRLLTTLDPALRARVLNVVHFDRDRVGRIMDFNFITVRADIDMATVQRFLRRRRAIPEGTDKLFITDKDNVLLGELPLTDILLNQPETPVFSVMNDRPTTFRLDDKAEDAAGAFERYNLISAAVIDDKGKLIGRVTIEDVIDLVNEENESNIRKMGGLSQEEEVFAPVKKAVRTRWTWLAINLCTAFVASRVIGLFEETISQLVALATLMPIVAGIGGNTGNQTITMIVRAMALDQVGTGNTARLLRKEVGVGLVNGLVWGGVIGVVAYWLYGSWSLGVVMTAAMTLNLLLAALMGVLIPMTLARLGRDPAMGASVMITAMTDSGGFFIFLGLATIFLL